MKLNPLCFLIAGLSGTGKTASLKNLREQEKWIYCCTEAGKEAPFKNDFKTANIVDPTQILGILDQMINGELKDAKGIIIDSLDFLMQQYEDNYIANARDSRRAWADYGAFFRTLMQDKIAVLGKPAIFIAHNQETFDDNTGNFKTSVVIKGSTKNVSVEAYFNTILYSKKVKIAEVKKYQNDLLTILPRDERRGVKFVFQTDVLGSSIEDKIRSPIDLWSDEELYIDNDCQAVIDRLTTYFGVNENGN